MNSILILIITYILNPILETSAGICAVKSMNHRSLRPTPADFFFYLGIILAVLLVPSEPAIFKWVFGLLLYLVYIFITVEDTALNRFLLFMLTHGSIFLLQCILLGIMYFIFRIEAFNGTGISFLGNFLTFVSAVAFFQLPFAKHLFDYVKQASYLLRILTLNTYLVILFCLAFFKIYPQQIYEILSLVITLLTLLAAINIWILYYDQRTRLQQQEIDSYQKNMPIYDSLIHESVPTSMSMQTTCKVLRIFLLCTRTMTRFPERCSLIRRSFPIRWQIIRFCRSTCHFWQLLCIAWQAMRRKKGLRCSLIL